MIERMDRWNIPTNMAADFYIRRIACPAKKRNTYLPYINHRILHSTYQTIDVGI